jgi:hypothetical protein
VSWDTTLGGRENFLLYELYGTRKGLTCCSEVAVL